MCTNCDIDDPPPKPTRNAQFVSQAVPVVMLAGMTQTVTIQFKNSGTLSWTSANNYKLGSQNPGDNIVWSMRRVELPKTVAPGETVTFNFKIKAPLVAGTYNFQWRMVMEGVAWFGTLSTNVAIKVVSGSIGATPNPCNIPADASTCTATIKWSSSGSSTEVWVGATPKLFARGMSGSQTATGITAAGSRFTLKSDGYTLDTIDVRGNQPPNVTWAVRPIGDVRAPASPQFAVYANDPDDGLQRLEFIADGAKLATVGAGGPFSTTWSNISIGTHTMEVLAYDIHGNSRSTGRSTFRVLASGSVTAAPNPCNIPAGADTCTATISWNSNSSTSEVWVGDTPQLFARGMLGSQVATSITATGLHFTLKNDGSTLDTIDVRGNQPPNVSWAERPIGDRQAPASLRFAVYANDPDDGLQRLEFLADGTKLATVGAGGPFSTTWSNIPIGSHTMEVVAYDTHGNSRSSGLSTFTVTSPPPVVSTSSSIDYDELGRVIARRDSAGHVKVAYQYDPNGNVTKITDALNHATTMTYDALDRLSTSTDAAGHVTALSYDDADRLIQVSDPRGKVTSYVFDGFGQLWRQVSPDTGTTSFAYDAGGLVSSMIRADGVMTSYGYDAINRLVSISAGGLTQQSTYDNCSNGVGRLCSTRDAIGTTSYTYAPEGEVTGRGFSIGGTTYALGYAYDAAGRIAAVTYPDGNRATYGYAKGRVSSVAMTVGTSTSNIATAVAYQPGDQDMTAWTSGNGLTNQLAYDSDGRLAGVTVPGIQDLAFTYDGADRITKITNGIDATMTQSFGYDALSRLTSVASVADNSSYQYDATGNRIAQIINGVAAPNTIEATSNRLVNFGGVALGYDPKGNTTTVSGVPTYHYDPFNRMDSAISTTYYVNPEGQRLRKSGGAGTSFFAPDNGGAMLAEYAGGWVDYVWLNGRLIGRVANGQIHAVHTDQLGRPEVVTNAAKAAVWRAKNFAFDRTVAAAGITLNLGFPGQYYDAESGLWNNGFRDYNPELGRYVQSDSIGLAGGANTYTYAAGNPISMVDPNGQIAYICQKGDDVSIVLPISFSGNYSVNDRDRMVSGIAAAWTGKIGRYNVVMNVVDGSSLNIPVNNIRIAQGNRRSFVEENNSGVWFATPSYINGLDYAHEAGHLMGLIDRPGFPSMMGDLSVGAPSEDEMRGILGDKRNLRTCGCGQ